MKKQILVLILPVVFACSCKTVKKASADTTVNIEVVTDESFRKPIVDKEIYKSTTEAVPLDTVYISKDTLNIVTKKILGCDAENFKLIWNGDMGKAIPRQAGVKLFQYVEADCKERHKFHLTYNISMLKIKADTATNKTTVITIGGWKRTTDYVHN